MKSEISLKNGRFYSASVSRVYRRKSGKAYTRLACRIKLNDGSRCAYAYHVGQYLRDSDFRVYSIDSSGLVVLENMTTKEVVSLQAERTEKSTVYA